MLARRIRPSIVSILRICVAAIAVSSANLSDLTFGALVPRCHLVELFWQRPSKHTKTIWSPAFWSGTFNFVLSFLSLFGELPDMIFSNGHNNHNIPRSLGCEHPISYPLPDPFCWNAILLWPRQTGHNSRNIPRNLECDSSSGCPLLDPLCRMTFNCNLLKQCTWAITATILPRNLGCEHPILYLLPDPFCSNAILDNGAQPP